MNLSPLNSLIRQCRTRVETYVEDGREKDMGPMQFASSYRILNFNLGRGSGHTSYIRDDFAEGEDLAIVHRNSMDLFKGVAGVYTSLESAIQAVRSSTKGYRDIWIDEPTYHLKGQRDVTSLQTLIETWRAKSKYSNGLVIFLGGHMV